MAGYLLFIIKMTALIAGYMLAMYVAVSFDEATGMKKVKISPIMLGSIYLACSFLGGFEIGTHTRSVAEATGILLGTDPVVNWTLAFACDLLALLIFLGVLRELGVAAREARNIAYLAKEREWIRAEARREALRQAKEVDRFFDTIEGWSATVGKDIGHHGPARPF